jgi:predicted RNA polymerase sigma factor
MRRASRLDRMARAGSCSSKNKTGTSGDERQIQLGLSRLARSAHGDVFSRFHAEAGIAAEHCLAPSLATTRWDRIVEYYTLLERLAPSAIHTLNRAVAVAKWRGPAEGLALLDSFNAPAWLEGSYLWAAVLADLHRRSGHVDVAEHYENLAIETAPSAAIRELLRRRLGGSPGRPSSP